MEATPSNLVGDWRYISDTPPEGLVGYFTLLPDCKYLGFSNVAGDEILKDAYPTGWLTVRYRLNFDSDSSVLFFVLRPPSGGTRHTYRFEGESLILERLKPYARWTCTRTDLQNMPTAAAAEREKALKRNWK